MQKQPQKQETNILIGCPCFGGAMHYTFTMALITLSQTLVNMKIRHQIAFRANESLVTVARDRIAKTLLDGDMEGRAFTHLLFLDADQGFQTQDILTMLNADKDIISLPYSPKSVNWERVAEAAKQGVPAKELPHFVGNPVCVALEGTEFRMNEISPVMFCGTGLMLIKTSVFHKMIAAHPEWKCRLPGDSDAAYHFFHAEIDPDTHNFLSEDFFFCNAAKRLGIETYVVPWAVTSHIGTFDYTMNIPAIAALEAQ